MVVQSVKTFCTFWATFLQIGRLFPKTSGHAAGASPEPIDLNF